MGPQPARRLGALVLVLAVAAAYVPVLGNGFISLDDPGYVVENPAARRGLSLETMRWAFTTTAQTNWHPLTWLSHLTDVTLFGLAPWGHHLTSLALHAANAALLAALLATLTGRWWPSWLAAALFGLHPLRVESVAWIAERKDVLSGLFFMLTLLAWARYVRADRTRAARAGRWYVLSLALLALGLMAKPMLVTLPGVLLLLDWWPLGRLAPAGGNPERPPWRRLARCVAEKAPFFLLAGVSAAVTWEVQSAESMVRTAGAYPLAACLKNAAISATSYLRLAVWPSGLAFPRAFPAQGQPAAAVVCSLALLAALTAASWRWRRRWPFLLLGWCWYLVTILPVSGVVQLADQGLADRYTYLPLIGPAAALAFALLPDRSDRRRARTALAAIIALALVALGAGTFRQALLWRDELSLFSQAVEADGGNWLARYNRGVALGRRGRWPEAEAEYRAVIELAPASWLAYVNLGCLLADRGETGEALRLFDASLRLNPGSIPARFNRANLLARSGRAREAAGEYQEVLRRDPRYAPAHLNLGNLFYDSGDRARAAEQYREALLLDPSLDLARSNLEALGER